MAFWAFMQSPIEMRHVRFSAHCSTRPTRTLTQLGTISIGPVAPRSPGTLTDAVASAAQEAHRRRLGARTHAEACPTSAPRTHARSNMPMQSCTSCTRRPSAECCASGAPSRPSLTCQTSQPPVDTSSAISFGLHRHKLPGINISAGSRARERNGRLVKN